MLKITIRNRRRRCFCSRGCRGGRQSTAITATWSPDPARLSALASRLVLLCCSSVIQGPHCRPSDVTRLSLKPLAECIHPHFGWPTLYRWRPLTGIADCCRARPTIGHVAAAAKPRDELAPFSFDHLVNEGEPCRRKFKTKCLRGFHVDDEIELGGLHNW